MARHPSAALAGRLRALSACTVALALIACAAKPVYTDKPLVRKIAVIGATDRSEVTLVNENKAVGILSPLVGIGVLVDSKTKAKAFDEAMRARRPMLAARLNAAVVQALRAAGYEMEVLDTLARPVDDPDDIDYAKLSTDAEVILQLRIDEVGVYSSTFSPDYLPRVNVQAKLYVRSRDDSIYDENLYFGADAKPGKPFMIVSDPKHAYPTFEALMSRSDELEGAFTQGIDELARMMAAQLLESLRTKARRAG